MLAESPLPPACARSQLLIGVAVQPFGPIDWKSKSGVIAGFTRSLISASSAPRLVVFQLTRSPLTQDQRRVLPSVLRPITMSKTVPASTVWRSGVVGFEKSSPRPPWLLYPNEIATRFGVA